MSFCEPFSAREDQKVTDHSDSSQCGPTWTRTYLFGPQNDLVLRNMAVVGVSDDHGQEVNYLVLVFDEIVLVHW